MKKLITFTTALLLAVTFSGCLTTLHPLFKAKDLVFEPKLVGNWRTDNSGSVIRYEKGTAASFKDQPAALQALAHKAYLVTVSEDGKVAQKMLGFLLRIGSNLYIDYYPLLTPDQQAYPGIYTRHFVPMHTICKIGFRPDGSLESSQFDQDFLEKLINQKQLRIRHEVYKDGGFVVTASTEELQQYVLKYGDVREAYEDASLYKKL